MVAHALGRRAKHLRDRTCIEASGCSVAICTPQGDLKHLCGLAFAAPLGFLAAGAEYLRSLADVREEEPFDICCQVSE